MTYNENRGQTFQMVRSEENLDEPHQCIIINLI